MFTYQTSVDGSRPADYDTTRTVNIYGIPGRKVLLLCTVYYSWNDLHAEAADVSQKTTNVHQSHWLLRKTT
jgi:hypothetical protein